MATKYIEPDPDCPDCGGTGEITTDERVYPNEPHTAPIGTRRCLCTYGDADDMDDDSDMGEYVEDDEDPAPEDQL